MFRCIALNIAAIVILLAFCSQAFTPAPYQITDRTSSSLGLFKFFGKEGEPQDAKTSKNTKDEPKKKEPFVFLYGKPQYDWVKGKPMERRGVGEFSWSTKAKPNTTPKKK